MHRSTHRAVVLWGLLCSGFLTSSTSVQAQQIEVGLQTKTGFGSTPWYEIHVDPENANNMILCGSRWNAKDNAFYGFVYSSSDRGDKWRTALEDKTSAWVSEESCAFGSDGVSYFVADASKVVNGEIHHDLGTTRIYVSHDSGRTWKLGITTGWTDYSTSVVDTTPGPNQNRLYVFFNGLLDFYNSIGKAEDLAAEKKASIGTRVGMVSWRDGDAHVAGPFTSTDMAKENYSGSYPAPSFLLKDGSIASFFNTKRRTPDGTRYSLVEFVRTTPRRTGIEAPAIVADSLDNSDADTNVTCAGAYLNTGGAYDPIHDKLYFAYPNNKGGQCGLWLTTSTDGGKAWSTPRQLRSPGDAHSHIYARVAIAVNEEGVLGVIWQDKYALDCWMFSASTDDGKSLSRSRQLGSCSPGSSKSNLLVTPYLYTSFLQADPAETSDGARINLSNLRNSVYRNERAIGLTPDGTFHPVWIETSASEAGIHTASIRVTSAATIISASTKGLEEVTNRVGVLYGGSQSYDSKTDTITLEVSLKNKSEKDLNGPFKLAVTSLDRDADLANIANADNGAAGAGAVWDVSGSVSGGVLTPGATTKPFSLKFHYLPARDAAPDSEDIVRVNVKIFAVP